MLLRGSDGGLHIEDVCLARTSSRFKLSLFLVVVVVPSLY